MDTESPLLSFIKSSLPKLRDPEPLLEHLQGLGVEELEDLSYIQENLLSVLRPIEARKLLSLLKKKNQQDVLDSPPSHQSSQQFSRASTSPVTQSDEMALSGNSTLAAENFMLSVDQTIVNGHIRIFSDALLLMFGSYYCMNISYPAAQASTLEFLQRCLFKINPDKRSKVQRNATKKQLAVSPKVLTLTKITDYEWRESQVMDTLSKLQTVVD